MAVPLPFYPAWPGLGAVFGMAALGLAVLAPALRLVRSPDRGVAAGWALGMSLAVGNGWFGMLISVLGDWNAQNEWRLEATHAAWLWIACVCGVATVLGLGRWLDDLPSRALMQGLTITFLFTGGLLLLQHDMGWVLNATEPALWWSVLILTAVAVFAVWWAQGPQDDKSSHSRARRHWEAASVFGLGAGMAVFVGWPATDPTGQSAHSGLTAHALAWLAASATLTLMIGIIVGWVDWRARGRNLLLSQSLSNANLRLREQALMDPLTRLPNRLQFEDQLHRCLRRAEQHGEALAVMFLDLDGFKPINDSFGHPAGDAVLQEMARRLAKGVRPSDFVARVGGDEFLVLLPRPENNLAVTAMAQRLMQLVAQPCILPNQMEVRLSCSIGVVLYPDFGPPHKLIACADAAMYAAKRAGGATFAFFEPRMEHDARQELTLQNELREALQRQELTLYYQPKIDARSGMVTGVEALVRWQHPQRGMIMPGLFIPVAERFGLISQLGNWVIDESCRQLADWREHGLRMRVAINVSAHQLRQGSLLDHLRSAMQRHQIEPTQITLEIVESVLMDDAAVRTFSGLATLGVGLSIDDFGIGYCNFALLRKLPVKQLKVDRSLFVDILTSADARSVVTAIVHMAHALNLRVVAEGVETEEQRDTLIGLRCDELQGYLFARPMPAYKLTLWAEGDAAAYHAGQPSSGVFRPSLFLEEDEAEETASQTVKL
jgi:diguanylate cyclase